MFLTVTPNPCIERTLRVPGFVLGQSHRVAPESVRVDAGGKGFNAARVALQLGASVRCGGWIGQDAAGWFRAQLDKDGVPHDLLEVEAPTRMAINVLDESQRDERQSPISQTEIVEAGHSLSVTDGTRLLAWWEQAVPRARLCAVCGSYPPSRVGDEAAWNAHATLLKRIAARHRVPFLLDGKGQGFAMAARSRPAPWAIKPNLQEAAELLGARLRSEADERAAVREMMRWGASVVLLSCGERGLWVGHEGGVWRVPAPRVPVVSAVGGGDALVGAFAARFLATGDVLEAARWGVAAGAANASQAESARVSRTDIEQLLPSVKVQSRVIALRV